MIVLAGAGSLLALYLANALFERLAPHQMLRAFQRRLGNPFGARVMRWLPGWAVIETTGRRTGLARRVPVGGRQIGEAFWFVAADPARAAYVRNIESDPRVRIQIRDRWNTGIAHLLPDDNPRKRMLRINPLNGLYILVAGREHLTVRVDLGADSPPDPKAPASQLADAPSRTSTSSGVEAAAQSRTYGAAGPRP